MDAFYPTEPFAAPHPLVTPLGRPLTTVTYNRGGKTYTLDDLMTRTYGNVLLVVRDGQVVYESYRNGATADSRFQIMSISKSVNAVLLGQAVAQGKIASIADPISRYLPELVGSAYEKVSIDDALQMRSGVVYDNEGDDSARFNAMTVRNETGGAIEFAETLKKRKSGRPYSYSTLEACVLGALVERVNGRSLSRITELGLWQPGRMASPGFWQIEGATGRGIAGGGLSITARDLARVGEIMLDGGRYAGRQVVPAKWVARIEDGRATAFDTDEAPWRYRDQWWVEKATNAIVGRGYMGQLLYIDRPTRTVIVKYSYVPDAVEFEPIEAEMVEAFHAIVAPGRGSAVKGQLNTAARGGDLVASR